MPGSSNTYTSVSGAVLNLAAGSNITIGSVTVSGNVVSTSISGNVVNISGQSVTIASGISVSVGSLSVSGNTVVVTSGGGPIEMQPYASATLGPVQTSTLLKVTGASGGSKLASGAVYQVTVRHSPSQSGLMFVGAGSGVYAPFSGQGFILTAGDAVTLAVNVSTDIAICATISGETVSWIGQTTP